MFLTPILAVAICTAPPDITVKFVNDDNEPIRGATVLVAPNGSYFPEERGEVTARGNGTFELAGVAGFPRVHIRITYTQDVLIICERIVEWTEKDDDGTSPPRRKTFQLKKPPRTGLRVPPQAPVPGYAYELAYVTGRFDTQRNQGAWTPMWRQVPISTWPSGQAAPVVVLAPQYIYPVYYAPYTCCYCYCE